MLKREGGPCQLAREKFKLRYEIFLMFNKMLIETESFVMYAMQHKQAVSSVELLGYLL